MQLVAKMRLAVLIGPVGSGLLGMRRAHAGLPLGRLVGRRHDGGVHQGALLQHQPLVVELPVYLAQAALKHARRCCCQTKAADRRLVGRRIGKRQPAEPAKVEAHQQRLLKTRVGEVVEQLQIMRLQHQQRCIRRPTGLAAAHIPQQRFQPRPIDQRIDALEPLVRSQPPIHKSVRQGKLP